MEISRDVQEIVVVVDVSDSYLVELRQLRLAEAYTPEEATKLAGLLVKAAHDALAAQREDETAWSIPRSTYRHGFDQDFPEAG